MNCTTCLFNEKKKCLWHDRNLSEGAPLCGGTHWELKPSHMCQKPEERIFQLATLPEDAIFARYAARYARQGFLVYPLIKGTTKPHRGSHAFYDATSDLKSIAAHAEAHPCDNIAVRTGKEGHHTQIDIDGRNGGFDTLAAHEREGRALPFDAHYETPSGGLHALFAYCPELPTGTHRLGPGIDIVNDGAGAPVPPSLRSDGRYTWKAWPSSGILPDVPQWCVDFVRAERARKEAKAQERAKNTVEIDPAKVSERERLRYKTLAESILERLAGQLSERAKPGRGRDLYTYAGFLAPYIRGDFIGEDEVRTKLEGACKTNGLEEKDGVEAIRTTMTKAFTRSNSRLADLNKLGDRPYSRAA